MQQMQQSSGRQAAKNLSSEFWCAPPARVNEILERVEGQLPPSEIPAFRSEIQRRAILAIIGLLIFLVVWCVTFSDALVGASPAKHRMPQQQQSPASTDSSEPNLKTIPF